MPKYLKIFLFAGIPFGLIMGLFFGVLFYSDVKNETSFLGVILLIIFSGLIMGILFGISMSVSFWILEYFMGKEIREKYPDKKQGVVQTEVIILDYSLEEKYKKSLEALKLIKASITNQDKNLGKIKAKTGFSLKSYGEIIEVNINPKNKEISISSKPYLPTTFLDYGKNLENVQKIREYLEISFK